MNSKPVAALSEVSDDIWLAGLYYASWRSDGAEHFRQKFTETVDWIAWNPDAFPRKYGPIQRAILKRSFYIAYFTQETDRSLIVAVLDGRQAPSEIRKTIGARRKSTRPPRM